MHIDYHGLPLIFVGAIPIRPERLRSGTNILMEVNPLHKSRKYE